MTMLDRMQEFTSGWVGALNQAAIERGVPERFVRAKRWSLSNLFKTDAGTWAFISFGDGKTVLAEWTEAQLNEALEREVPKLPETWRIVGRHRQYRSSPHSFDGELGGKIFTMNFQGETVEVTWWELRENTAATRSLTTVERAYIHFNMDGSVKPVGYYKDRSGDATAPKKGANPLTEAMLAELDIEFVFEWRPATVDEAHTEFRRAFINAHAPAAERQQELQAELTDKGIIAP